MMHSFIRGFLTDVVTKWNAGQKMALFMVLMAFEINTYILWMLYIQGSSYAQQFVNIDVINTMFPWVIGALALILIFAYCFYRYQTHKKFIFIFQLIVMIIYSLAAGYVGYLVGQDSIMSAIAISTAGILIVLFCDRKLAAWVVLLNLFIMFAVMYASKTGIFPPSEFYVGTRDSAFWVFSYIHLCALKVLVILLLADNILYVLEENYEKSKFLSEHDPLTNLPNRMNTQSYLLESLRNQKNVSLVMMDLDYFKQINDSFGHVFGDKVLVKVARLLTTNLREFDLLGRYGGEEFVLILPNTNLEQATQVAKNLHSIFNTLSIPINDIKDLKPKASFGVAATDFIEDVSQKSRMSIRDKQSSEHMLKQLFELADKAMYHAKNNGRNQVCSIDEIQTPINRKQSFAANKHIDLQIVNHHI